MKEQNIIKVNKMFDIYLRTLKDFCYDISIIKILNFVLKKLKITPNMITFCAFMVGLLSVYNLYKENTKWALFLWLMNRFLDGLDGMYARETAQTSDFGGYLDIITDFMVYLK